MQHTEEDRGLLAALLARGQAAIRERPLAAVGSAAAMGYVVGSLSPRIIARPLGLLALRTLISRLVPDAATD